MTKGRLCYETWGLVMEEFLSRIGKKSEIPYDWEKLQDSCKELWETYAERESAALLSFNDTYPCS